MISLTDCRKFLTHEWAPASQDSRRRCVHCNLPGRGNFEKGESGFFQDATAARSELFSGLRSPASAWGGKKK